MGTSPGRLQADRRSRREAARRRILDAARALLEEQAWPAVSLDEIMRAAGLSRTVFYRHFEDRRELLLALLDDSELALDLPGTIWKQAPDDPVPALRAALRRLTEQFAEQGRLLQAVADMAGQDPEVRAIWMGLGEQLTRTTAERISAEVASGRSAVRDPLEVARALVWMNERYLLVRFGRRPLADPETAAAALAEIWHGAIYRG
jgi:AcrR family transcriptional regulator